MAQRFRNKAAKRLTVSFGWEGLDDFKAELEGLPDTLTAESDTILRTAADQARRDIVAAYPRKTGNLRRGVQIRALRGSRLGGVALVQAAPHGWIYERGTKPRYNRRGAFRGVMPPSPTFEPIARAAQRVGFTAVIDRLYAHGAASVTGAPEV